MIEKTEEGSFHRRERERDRRFLDYNANSSETETVNQSAIRNEGVFPPLK